jgi:hypothetical protein
MKSIYAQSIVLGKDKYAFVLRINTDGDGEVVNVFVPPDLYKSTIRDAAEQIKKYETEYEPIDESAVKTIEPVKLSNGEKEFT